MSSPIWTPDELCSNRQRREATAWRAVEAQHRVSTMKLVDSLEEQKRLEEILEVTKPPVPAPCRNLHYLLFTPFRYGAPYPAGSRFRRAGFTAGVFYGSSSIETALAELAFHRLLFFAESPDTPFPKNPAELTLFAVALAAAHALDLSAPTLNRYGALWRALSDYTACQTLADQARTHGVTLIAYTSVRDPGARLNYAVLDCSAFAAPAPVALQTWRLHVRFDRVLATSESTGTGLTFSRASFLADPRLAAH